MPDSHSSTNKITESFDSGTDSEMFLPGSIQKKPFRELFSRDELWYYGIAAVAYVILGVIFKNTVLNCSVGPLFIVLWMWWVPPLVEKWMERQS